MSPSSKGKRSVSSDSAESDPSVSSKYKPGISQSTLYYLTLKLLLLEYINEPRFQKYQEVPKAAPPPIIRRTPRKNLSGAEEDSRIMQISNGFKSSSSKSPSEVDSLQDTLKQLENHLSGIAMKRIAVDDENLRRSLLKFYNDLFLNPCMTSTLESMERFEELIVYFTKAANGELNKLIIGNVRRELHAEVSYFIDLLIRLTNLPNELVQKLRQYKESDKPQKHRLKKHSAPYGEVHSHSSSSSSVPTSQSSYASNKEGTTPSKPTFKLQEITHVAFFQQLFEVDEAKLQKDIIRVIREPLGDIYCKELLEIGENIRKGVGALKIHNFPTEKDYNLWANIELSEIAYLTDKFTPEKRAAGFTSQPHSMIPENPREVFVALLCKIFQHERSTSMNNLNLSKSALFFLHRASKCWRVEFYSTLASLVYTAANLSILQDEELNEHLTENLLNFIHSKILRSEDQMDTSNWNDVDQTQWMINLVHTSNQCLMSIDNLISALYASTKPKFSPVLSFYYTYIDADPAMLIYKQRKTSTDARMAKKLRRAVFKTSEEFYISLLDKVPKDKSIEIQHIHNIGELIIEQIKSIQKRYNKPLLDVVNLPFECASVLIEAFASDAPTMIERVEKYTLAKSGEHVGPVDALEMYDMLKELRSIYKQVQPKRKFPFNLEKIFTKYLSRLCDGVSSKVLKVIKESVKNEKWEQANSEVAYSSSVLDIFKMINESIRLFKNLDWGSDYQIAKIITFLLKSFSDGLHFYANLVLKMIEDDLSDDSSEILLQEDDYKITNVASDKSKNSWVDGMRSALKNSQPVEIPKPYQFKPRTCVLLNDLDSVIEKLNDLDGQLNLEELSETIKKHERKHRKSKSISNNSSQQLHQLYTIRVIGAENIRGFSSIDGLSNPVLSLVDTSQQREIGKTKIIRKSVNPVWDEEFEVDIPFGNTRTIVLTVWHRPSAKLRKLNSYDVCGKCTFLLDAKRYTDDGFPNAVTLDLDTQGKVFLEVSLESEKLDAVFCMGRAYRTVSRALDRAIELIAHKFSTFVNFAFSRSTLRTVCGSSGTTVSPKALVYDAILPLFDYLNANLSILASELTQALLFRVMLRAWASILTAADSLLLPSLSMAKIKKMQSTKSIWGNAMSALGNTTVVGYGRPLTQREIEVIFVWLNALCVDFFHNEGEGPPLSDLKNRYYQSILLIPVYYDQSIPALKKEADRLFPEYTKYLHNKTLGVSSNRTTSTRSRTLARKQTVVANATKKNRKQAEMDVQRDESDPLERSAETIDIVLRTLMAKGELDYVQKQLSGRKKIRKNLATERKVQAAVRGQKIR
ncbi:uncharacterized protein ZBAI_07594 [Zygosaccharomyces bailii ISA1307]|nr:uncharacterized protein ZBAI_07594 [Zygosaccharomyces bailii ISA1307]